MKKNRVFQLAAIGIMMVGAVVFGMVLAGGLELTPEVAVASLPKALGQEARPARPDQERFAFAAQRQIASFADLAEAVLPAVVTVHSTTVETAEGEERPDAFRFFSRRRDEPPRERQGLGSGFLISEDGWIVTNHHVVDGATKVEVVLGDETLIASVKGVDRSTDLAVLKVERTGLPFLVLGDSGELRVGDWVMAVGSPLGLGSSVTVGVVSAKGRVLPGLTGDRAFDDFIQTDAAINRGNSGGPLVDTRGMVVGVSTAMRVAAENIGFAVPSRILADVIPQLQGEGRVERGYLGIAIKELSEDLWRVFPGVTSTDGVLITAIQAEPARRAGLEAGDVVVSVDGHPVTGTSELIDRVSHRKPKERVKLEVIRQGKRLTKTVVLGNRESGLARARVPVIVEDERRQLDWLGAVVRELDRELRERLSLPKSLYGVVLVEIGASSKLAEEGVQDYDIVLEANGKPVRSIADFKAQVGKVRSGERLLLFIHSPTRGGFQDFVVVRVP